MMKRTSRSLSIGLPSGVAFAASTDLGFGGHFAPVAAEGAAFTVEEITVTARKREESLRDVPVAITAIGGQALEARGIDNVTNMIGTVPSLFTTQNQTFGPMPNQTYLV